MSWALHKMSNNPQLQTTETLFHVHFLVSVHLSNSDLAHLGKQTCCLFVGARWTYA